MILTVVVLTVAASCGDSSDDTNPSVSYDMCVRPFDTVAPPGPLIVSSQVNRGGGMWAVFLDGVSMGVPPAGPDVGCYSSGSSVEMTFPSLSPGAHAVRFLWTQPNPDPAETIQVSRTVYFDSSPTEDFSVVLVVGAHGSIERNVTYIDPDPYRLTEGAIANSIVLNTVRNHRVRFDAYVLVDDRNRAFTISKSLEALPVGSTFEVSPFNFKISAAEITIPEESAEGSYAIGVSVQAQDTGAIVDWTVQIEMRDADLGSGSQGLGTTPPPTVGLDDPAGGETIPPGPVTAVNISGTWVFVIDVDKPNGDCADEEQYTRTVTIIHTPPTVKVIGLGDGPEEWEGALDGNVLTFGGDRMEDGGTTTADFSITLNESYDAGSGIEEWGWVKGDSDCAGSKSSVETEKVG